MLPGECILNTETTCMDCGATLHLQVLKTCAYYLGFFCPNCGPYSRETDYMSESDAQAMLDSGDIAYRS